MAHFLSYDPRLLIVTASLTLVYAVTKQHKNAKAQRNNETDATCESTVYLTLKKTHDIKNIILNEMK